MPYTAKGFVAGGIKDQNLFGCEVMPLYAIICYYKIMGLCLFIPEKALSLNVQIDIIMVK